LHDGRTLIRLDPATGSKRWSCSLGSQDLSERPGAMVYDDRRFYFVNTDNIYGGPRPAVRAIALENGSDIWSQALSGDRGDLAWSIALTQRYVITYPANNTPATDDVGKLPVTVMPVIVRRRETGELVQRFVFPTKFADLTLKADPHGGLVATSMGLWGLGSKEASSSPLSDRGH
jgi:cellulose synthase operon protein C